MATRITNDVVESYVLSKYKGYLKLLGQQGLESEYETLLRARRREAQLAALDTIRARHPGDQIARHLVLSASALENGPSFVLEALAEDDLLSVSIDGLKKVSGVSKLGPFLYVPMLFAAGTRGRDQQRLLLELHALLLSRYQGMVPSTGLIWHGRDANTATVRLNPDLRKAKRTVLELKKLSDTEARPRLILNDHCQICEFRQRCRDQALEEDNLSLLRGISQKEIWGYARKGILTVTQLAHTFRPRRKGKRSAQGTSRRQHALQALALRDQRLYVHGTPVFPRPRVCIYLDVESDPEAGFVYLIGLVVVEGGSERRYSFWAATKAQEPAIFERFVAEVARHEDFLIYCYGDYERAFIKRMRKAATSPAVVDRIEHALVNVLSLIYAHLYFPTYSNGLKEVGRYLGCAWSAPNASGLQSMVWRARWEADRDEAWKRQLEVYNLEDCTALQRVAEVLQTVSMQATSADRSPAEDGSALPIALVQDVEKLSDYHTWDRVQFVHPDYEFVNTCAYFDYQRERVYVRTSKALRKTRAGKTRSPNRTLKASRSLMIVASHCPVCGSERLLRGISKPVRTPKPRVKRAFDLVLTPTGVRRIVVECRTSVHRCVACGAEFIPDQHQRLDKHFHGLKSWAMYQHVTYRTSLKALTKLCEAFFGIRVHFSEMHMFKALMAAHYATTYRRVLERILSGTLLHVDETEVALQQGKGYVWVFTSLEEVVYMYRPTREGDFLHELLQGFSGVLVSDFYGACDGIECAQQKCLIHLLRDMNQALLDHPFDDDLKLITQPFGALLRRIVSTIDVHGLQRRQLRQYEAAVERYCRSLAERIFDSEAAEALRLRLTKYRHKLFTFLSYDGVPWNNNNAEYAIKQFAYYRELATASLVESGLRDYLVLLSIAQTCHYKGVGFLEFLLSAEQDVDQFCRRPRRRRRRPPLEFYPEGFVPPHFASKHKERSRPAREGPEVGV